MEKLYEPVEVFRLEDDGVLGDAVDAVLDVEAVAAVDRLQDA